MLMANAFDEVAKNKWKSYFLMFVFAAIIIAIGYVFGMVWGGGDPVITITFMVLAFIIAVAMGLFSYYGGDKAALSISNAKPADPTKHAFLINTVEGLAIAAQIPKPKVYVIPDPSINAFATGRDPQHASLAVTQGALDKLKRNELEGVVAHEMGHIKNYDMRLMMIVVILVGLITLLSEFFLRSMWFGGGRNNNREGGGGQLIFIVIGIVLAILAPIIAALIQLAISRKREYAADASGAVLTRYPEGLASALKMIKKDNEPTSHATKATAHMYFSNPLKKGWFNSMFDTHPPIDSRIARLEAM
jgi:heat shock protein HtpX